MILRNHGLLTCGKSMAEAFLAMYVLEAACRIQVLAQAGGKELIQVHPQIVAGIKLQSELVLKGMGAELAFPALLRKLDRIDPGFRN